MADTVPPIWAHDDSPYEVESRAELDAHRRTGSLAGLTVQGLDLIAEPVDLGAVDLRDTLFVGCRLPDPADLVRRGAHVVPVLGDAPYAPSPGRLYTPEDLAAGFAEHGFEGMYDTAVFRHFLAHGGALPDVREALAQRLHDAGVDNALADATAGWVREHGTGTVVGVMGGHAVPRGSAAYRQAASLAHRLTGAGRLVVTGGGPGVMEAANLGAYLGDRDPAELTAAIDVLAGAPDFRDSQPYTAAALRVRAMFPAPADGLRRGGLAIPTWLYGHEPANLFGAGIAKYFSNAIREDTILRLARGGLVFAAGRAGTVQEVFQAATKVFYGLDGPGPPLVFLDTAFWTSTVPVEALLRPLLAASPQGDLSGLVHLTDDVSAAAALLTGA